MHVMSIYYKNYLYKMVGNLASKPLKRAPAKLPCTMYSQDARAQ